MAAYASVQDVQARMDRALTTAEQAECLTLLDDAAVIIDQFASESASTDAKKLVSCRMVIRALGDSSDVGIPAGATQGSMSGLGYSQSWTFGSAGGSGSSGELYLSKLEKQLLGCGNRIGSRSPIEDLVRTIPEGNQ